MHTTYHQRFLHQLGAPRLRGRAHSHSGTRRGASYTCREWPFTYRWLCRQLRYQQPRAWYSTNTRTHAHSVHETKTADHTWASGGDSTGAQILLLVVSLLIARAPCSADKAMSSYHQIKIGILRGKAPKTCRDATAGSRRSRGVPGPHSHTDGNKAVLMRCRTTFTRAARSGLSHCTSYCTSNVQCQKLHVDKD